jgi:hypothetical protein
MERRSYQPRLAWTSPVAYTWQGRSTSVPALFCLRFSENLTSSAVGEGEARQRSPPPSTPQRSRTQSSLGCRALWLFLFTLCSFNVIDVPWRSYRGLKASTDRESTRLETKKWEGRRDNGGKIIERNESENKILIANQFSRFCKLQFTT